MSYIGHLVPAEVMMVITLHLFGEVVRIKRVVYQRQSLRVAWPPHAHLGTADNLGNAKFILGACLSGETRIPVRVSKFGTRIEIFLLGGMICKLFSNPQHGDVNCLL